MNSRTYRQVALCGLATVLIGALLATGWAHAQGATFAQRERIQLAMDNSPELVIGALESILSNKLRRSKRPAAADRRGKARGVGQRETEAVARGFCGRRSAGCGHLGTGRRNRPPTRGVTALDTENLARVPTFTKLANLAEDLRELKDRVQRLESLARGVMLLVANLWQWSSRCCSKSSGRSQRSIRMCLQG